MLLGFPKPLKNYRPSLLPALSHLLQWLHQVPDLAGSYCNRRFYVHAWNTWHATKKTYGYMWTHTIIEKCLIFFFPQNLKWESSQCSPSWWSKCTSTMQTNNFLTMGHQNFNQPLRQDRWLEPTFNMVKALQSRVKDLLVNLLNHPWIEMEEVKP